MNEEEKRAIEYLKHSIFEYEEIDTSVMDYMDEQHKNIYKLILKQQEEIEKLKRENIVKGYILDNDVVTKDKIKEKMRGEINKSWRNTGQRKCQLYAYDILKELLGE